MAKFYGPIGFAERVETAPSVWVDRVIERDYYGDLVKHGRQLETSGGVNDDININNNISIVGDPYAMDHIYQMRYVEFMGTKWKIKNVDASQYPRLILILGGVYNG